MKFATFTLQKDPFHLYVKIEKDYATQTDFRDLFNSLLQVFDFEDRFTLHVDATSIERADLSAVPFIAGFMKEHRPKFKEQLIASAIVINSEMVRDLINMVFHVVPPSAPNIVTLDNQKGVNFIESYRPCPQ